MATHDDIGLSQPAASTITHRLDAVSLDHNSTIVLREVLVVGSPETTNALAAVLNTTPASTAWALAVRDVVPNSTTIQVSSLAGAVVVRSSAANALVSVYQSTAADLNVTVAGYVAPSTLAVVRQSTYTELNGLMRLADRDQSTQVAGVLNAHPASTVWALAVRMPAPITDSTNDALRVNVVAGAAGGSTEITVRQSTVGALRAAVYQSTAADLNVTVAGYSTTVNVSSLGGAVIVRSSAANHLGTVYQSTAADLAATVHGNTSSNSSAYLPVRITDGTAFVDVGQDYQQGSTMTSSAVYGATLMLRTGAPAPASTDTWKMIYGSTVGVMYSAIATDSGVSAMDSTNTALRVNVVAGAAAGSTEVTVRQSTVGALRAAVYQSTATDLNAVVSQGSTAWSVQVSTGAISVSTGSVTIHQGSTNFSVQVSTGAVSVSTGSVTVHQGSTAFSVQSRVTTSSGGGVEGSTTTPGHGVIGLHVRQVVSSLQSVTSVINSSNSTAVYEVISSVAAVAHRVYAYFVGSTTTLPSTLVFMSSASIDRFAVNYGSGSSGISGANLAIAPPHFLFRTDAQNALNVRVESGATGQITRLSLSYFTE